MALFAALSVLGLLAVVVFARARRGPFFARFATVILGIHVASTAALFEATGRWWPAFAYLQATVLIHFGSLIAAQLRPAWWRALVSIPGLTFAAGAFLALPWAVAQAAGFPLPAPWLPFLLATFGTVQGLWPRREQVHIELGGDRPEVEGVVRHPRGGPRTPRPLRLVQITDPHLGPFMSAGRLRQICQRAVEAGPDLVLITGDLLTMESHAAVEALTFALEPLRALPGRGCACLGLPASEAPRSIPDAFRATGVRLLLDEEALVETEAGAVQILGLEHVWQGRQERIVGCCARHPRRPGHLRLLLLHDPSAFHHVPSGDADLVLSGHTHGGQLGLVSLGLPYTFLSFFPRIPDHGLWARGRDRLYVHRGTGHYGFPVRLGVPAEESVLHLHHA